MVVAGLLIRQRGLFILDTFVAMLLTVLIAHQMIPIMVQTATVLMQATPPQLPAARLLRELSTIHGVLEVSKKKKKFFVCLLNGCPIRFVVSIFGRWELILARLLLLLCGFE